jgi:hypothetical protein
LQALKLAGRAFREPPPATLREEIAAARAEWATAPRYEPVIRVNRRRSSIISALRPTGGTLGSPAT